LKSLYLASIHDDYKLLEAPKGMLLDHERSNLKKIWEEGSGTVTYTYHVEQMWDHGVYGTMITGDPLLFLPKLDKLREYVDSSHIYIRDASSKGVKRIFIARHKGVRMISDDDIYEMCLEACSYRSPYKLNVADAYSNLDVKGYWTLMEDKWYGGMPIDETLKNQLVTLLSGMGFSLKVDKNVIEWSFRHFEGTLKLNDKKMSSLLEIQDVETMIQNLI
jgi:hypothetical protein